MFSVNCLFLNCSLSQLWIKIYRIVFYKFLDGRPGYCKSNVSKIMEENFHMCHYFCLDPDQKSWRICILTLLIHFPGEWSQIGKLKIPTPVIIQVLALIFHSLAAKLLTSLQLLACEEAFLPGRNISTTFGS